MKAGTACPKCGGMKIRRAERAEWEGVNPFRMPAVKPRTCEACGQVWEPAAPTWVLVGGLVAGLLIVGLAVMLAFDVRQKMDYFAVAVAAVMGVTGIVNSILRMRKRGIRLIESSWQDST